MSEACLPFQHTNVTGGEARGNSSIARMGMWSYVSSSRHWTTRTAGHLGLMQAMRADCDLVALYRCTEWRYQRPSL